MSIKQLTVLQDVRALAQAIVDTVREPLVVLDHDLRVVAASRSFYARFVVNPDDTVGKLLYELATVNGTFQSFECCWKKSYPSTA